MAYHRLIYLNAWSLVGVTVWESGLDIPSWKMCVTIDGKAHTIAFSYFSNYSPDYCHAPYCGHGLAL